LNIEPTSLVVVAVFILTILGVAYGLKTRKGSGIDEHPGPGSGDPAEGPGSGETGQMTEEERPDSTLLDQHGKKWAGAAGTPGSMVADLEGVRGSTKAYAGQPARVDRAQ
jgi:hypothetical protein